MSYFLIEITKVNIRFVSKIKKVGQKKKSYKITPSDGYFSILCNTHVVILSYS